MSARKRSKKGGRSRRRAARLPAAAAEAALSRLRGGGEGTGGAGESSSVPSSFVIRRGRLTSAARQLVRDMRRVMLPHCSERLRERRSSKLKDYLAAASLLGVTHLQLFTQTDAGFYFKLVQLPAGPTLSFRVLRFSLVHDVQCYQQQRKRNARAPDARDFLHPPLLILSPQTAANKNRQTGAVGGAAARNGETKDGGGGGGEGQEQDVEGLVARVVKSAFPPIDIRTVALRDCRRVVLFRRDCGASDTSAPSSLNGQKSTFQYQLRQYAVVRRVAQDSTQVTPGVRALVEAGGSRVAADRMLQQQFGISLQSDSVVSADERRMIGTKNKVDSSTSDGRRPSAAAAANADAEEVSNGDTVKAGKTGRDAAAFEASGERAEAEATRKRKQQRPEQRKKEQEDAASLRQRWGVEQGAGYEERAAGGEERQKRRRACGDICEATLAREHATTAETDDEEGLSFDVAEVGTGDAAGLAHGISAARRSREGLLLLSVAAAAQQREKKQSARVAGAADTDAAEENRVPRALASENEIDGDDQLIATAAEVAAQREVAGEAASVEGEDLNKQKNEKVKMNVSLVELGPRMHLELIKVEEDVCSGAVVFHNFVKKTSGEVLELQKREAALRRQREKERVAVQKAFKQNLQKKERWKDAHRSGCGKSDDHLPSGDCAPDAGSSERVRMRELKSALLEEPTNLQGSMGGGALAATGRNHLRTGDPTEGENCSSTLDLRSKGNTEADKSCDRAAGERFRSECRGALVSPCATVSAAGGQRNESGKLKAYLKRKGGSIVNVEGKTSKRDASAVLRRYEEATARQSGGTVP